MDEHRKEKAWVKEGDPYPFIKAVKSCASPLALKLAYSPSVVRMARLGNPCPY